MKKGKFLELLDNIYGSETALNVKIEVFVKKIKKSFLKIQGKDDSEILEGIYRWFQENFGEVE